MSQIEFPIEPMSPDGTIRVHPIGVIRSRIAEQQTGGFNAVESTIELDSRYKGFLEGLEGYSHLIVLYWLSEQTRALAVTQPQSHPEAPYVGMFACR